MGVWAPGFTLVETLIAVVIFTGIMATLFSVVAALQRVDRFRDDNSTVTQAAQFAFEPVVRAIKSANAIVRLPIDTQCVGIRGFYGQNQDGTVDIASARSDSGLVFTGAPTEAAVLVTVQAEEYQDGVIGKTSRWVKREYRLASNQDSANQTITETTYFIAASDTQHLWPHPLDGCSSPIEWTSGTARYLTSSRVSVTQFNLRIAPPLVTAASDAPTNSPFATVSFTVANPTAKSARPLSLQTTITPTFVYGEQRE